MAMSKKVILKGIAFSFFGGIPMDVYYGIKQFGYDRVKNNILYER